VSLANVPRESDSPQDYQGNHDLGTHPPGLDIRSMSLQGRQYVRYNKEPTPSDIHDAIVFLELSHEEYQRVHDEGGYDTHPTRAKSLEGSCYWSNKAAAHESR
jgi:hypothetical protein